MIDEEEIFALMQAAKDQQAAVQQATQAMQTQRGELYNAIAQLRNMRASVEEGARRGAENGLFGITSKANEALDVEVTKARQTIGEVAEDLRIRAWGKSLKWVAGSLTVGFALGFVLCWFMWGRNARDAVMRFDSINAQLQRIYNQHGEPVGTTPPAAKPPRQNQHTHMQQRSQVNAPVPSEVPQEQP